MESVVALLKEVVRCGWVLDVHFQRRVHSLLKDKMGPGGRRRKTGVTQRL